ncbi:hypothetical protein NDU88_008113 [Pleurodeles waltl]|uniref:Uncharacterized protein n=1 Tax=Pleurodeles waltl TaxID=8319 RepID=A0AAV7QTR7_PLEWA|nr:hypothetical protein NDU88_008113 [Pleurodeles waltl]
MEAAQKQLAYLDLNKTKYSILHLEQSFHVGGNKCGGPLANRLHVQCHVMCVEALSQTDNSEIRNDDLFTAKFRDFYSDLYTTQPITADTIDGYLKNANIPHLSSIQVEEIDQPIRLEEVIAVIAHLKLHN